MHDTRIKLMKLSLLLPALVSCIYIVYIVIPWWILSSSIALNLDVSVLYMKRLILPSLYCVDRSISLYLNVSFDLTIHDCRLVSDKFYRLAATQSQACIYLHCI